MRLQPVSLRGRGFSIQFGEIINEFGRTIPWLNGLQDLQYATNGTYVRDELLRRMRQEEDGITPYQFQTDGRAKEFLGGVIHFAASPEQFRDRRNRATSDHLACMGASYISCLQIRADRRMGGVGNQMMRRALKAILATHGSVWGVVSDPHLIAWYRSLGAKVQSPLDNDDHLWIVSWR